MENHVKTVRKPFSMVLDGVVSMKQSMGLNVSINVAHNVLDVWAGKEYAMENPIKVVATPFLVAHSGVKVEIEEI